MATVPGVKKPIPFSLQGPPPWSTLQKVAGPRLYGSYVPACGAFWIWMAGRMLDPSQRPGVGADPAPDI